MDGKTIIKELKSSPSNHDVNRTIYINNLNDRVSLSKQKLALEGIFEKYGKIESIKTFNSYFRKGQAWVTFSNADSAVNAVKNEIGTQLFGKYVNVSFAAKESENRNIAVQTRNSKTQMIPKSIYTRIELYKQYLAQWLKNARNNGFLQTLGTTEKNHIETLNNQVLYDTNYANFMDSNKHKKFGAQSLVKNESTLNSLKGRLEMQTNDTFLFRYNKPPNNMNPQEVSNTVFVQIEMGMCKEEELYILFSHLNGFKELRFIPVSFKSYLIVLITQIRIIKLHL
ncbi:U1 snrnp [Cryptosporidium sp. chipmunk genotype I]|uniref:U1 snrnp n=1 Tax=Cryptosporidium sp. chipmunk genotype I TaxID=1280935 RepID=UPI00351A613A|nr:U1 snrnp [Cryptosporidium sp. chipmunk genotype I]